MTLALVSESSGRGFVEPFAALRAKALRARLDEALARDHDNDAEGLTYPGRVGVGVGHGPILDRGSAGSGQSEDDIIAQAIARPRLAE